MLRTVRSGVRRVVAGGGQRLWRDRPEGAAAQGAMVRSQGPAGGTGLAVQVGQTVALPSSSLVHRADGALVDAGHTYLSAPALVERAQWLLDQAPRQGLAAFGLYALLVTGWSAWRSGGRICAGTRELSCATGAGPRAVSRSLALLEKAGLIAVEGDGVIRLVPRFLPRAQRGRLEKGARALSLVHRETWEIRNRLAERSDVTTYHLLRDLGAHVLQLVCEEAGRTVAAASDRRTIRRRAARLHAAKLRNLHLERPRVRNRRGSAGAVDPVAAPPGGWEAFREQLGVPARARPPSS